MIRTMNIRIRPFAPEDVHAFVDVYNQARPIEIAQLTEERFWAWFSDPALDPTRDVWVAEDDEGLVGGVAAFPWTGHLKEGYVFFVGPSVLGDFQHHGVGGRLMEAMIADLRERFPGKTLQTRLHPSNAGAQAFLARLGFTVDRQFWSMAHHAPGRIQPDPPPEGVRFGYMQPQDDPAEAIRAYRRILDDPLTSHHQLDREELAGWAGLETFTHNSFLVARDDDQVVGLCFQTFPPGCDFGQIQFLGVLKAHRGRGLATAMLKQALADAHANGRHRVRLEVSGDSTVAQALYAKLGFEVTDGEVFYQLPLSQAVRP